MKLKSILASLNQGKVNIKFWMYTSQCQKYASIFFSMKEERISIEIWTFEECNSNKASKRTLKTGSWKLMKHNEKSSKKSIMYINSKKCIRKRFCKLTGLCRVNCALYIHGNFKPIFQQIYFSKWESLKSRFMDQNLYFYKKVFVFSFFIW